MAILPGPNEDYPFKVECKRPNCFFHSLMPTLNDARRWDKPSEHGCPRGVDTNVGASLTLSLLEKSWQMLDGYLVEIMNAREAKTPQTDPDLKFIQGKARGITEMLAIFMVPHFTTPEQVTREAMRRWKCIQDGEAPETPGIKALKYTFPSDKKYTRMEAREAETKALREKGLEPVDDKTKASVLTFRGIMPAAKLGETLGLSAATVERIWAES